MKKLIAILLLLPWVTGILLLLSMVFPKQAKGNELTCMADNIYFESRGESEAGQFLTGFITMNRVRDPRWPNTICKVVYQPNQFEWVNNGHSNTPYKSEVYFRIIYIASIVLQAEEIQHYGYFFNTTHAKSKSTVVAGNHRFYE